MPQATAAAIISKKIGNETQILLTLRVINPFKGQWCIPGGHIEGNEPVRDAVIREVKEETGLQFDAIFFNYFDEIIPPNIHQVVLVFDGPAYGDIRFAPEEVEDIRWFSIEQALELPLAFQHNVILKAYIERAPSVRESST
jgi:8-oxo-dGTP diphosphatase